MFVGLSIWGETCNETKMGIITSKKTKQNAHKGKVIQHMEAKSTATNILLNTFKKPAKLFREYTRSSISFCHLMISSKEICTGTEIIISLEAQILAKY